MVIRIPHADALFAPLDIRVHGLVDNSLSLQADRDRVASHCYTSDALPFGPPACPWMSPSGCATSEVVSVGVLFAFPENNHLCPAGRLCRQMPFARTM